MHSSPSAVSLLLPGRDEPDLGIWDVSYWYPGNDGGYVGRAPGLLGTQLAVREEIL
jgi:hypothetical protein